MHQAVGVALIPKRHPVLKKVFENLWLRRTALAVLIWTAIGCVFALPGMTAMGAQWRMQLLASLAQWWSWGLIAPAIVTIDKHLPFTDRQLVARIAAHIPLGFVLTAVYIYVFAAVVALLGLGPWSRVFQINLLLNALRGMFLWSVLVYCLIVGVWRAHLYYRRYLSGQLRIERMERSFSEARLNALRMQLDPHFLFNALNTISAQVEREPRIARQMIQHLGDLLRLSLENRDRHEVPLAEELAFLDHYLAIQKTRFGERLRVELRIAPEIRYALVPSLILQPLVENAIRHGIASRTGGGSILVSAQPSVQSASQLEILIQDDGVGLPPGWTLDSSTGLGLSLTRQRLSELHNGASRLTIRRRVNSSAASGTEVTLLLPLRLNGPEEALAKEASNGSSRA